jgi:phosphomannomutase
VADLQREYGLHYYRRRDLHITEEMKQSAVQRARSDQTTQLGRYSIKRKEALDGIKFFLDLPSRGASKNGSGAIPWVLFRMSGTEPLLRVYTEAETPELVTDILSVAEAFVRRPA